MVNATDLTTTISVGQEESNVVRLETWDIVTIVLYFMLVVGVGLFVSCLCLWRNRNQKAYDKKSYNILHCSVAIMITVFHNL